jgi:hypothetical protein
MLLTRQAQGIGDALVDLEVWRAGRALAESGLIFVVDQGQMLLLACFAPGISWPVEAKQIASPLIPAAVTLARMTTDVLVARSPARPSPILPPAISRRRAVIGMFTKPGVNSLLTKPIRLRIFIGRNRYF